MPLPASIDSNCSCSKVLFSGRALAGIRLTPAVVRCSCYPAFAALLLTYCDK
jgi:hypothetical protein